MKVTIERLELNNYRSCQRTRFDLDPDLSVLIGPNGSGKTNLLHGLLLLRKLARFEPSRRDDLPTSTCSLKCHFNVGGYRVLLKARIGYSTDEHNNDELISAVQEWDLFSVTRKREWIRLPLNVFEKGSEATLFDYRFFRGPRGQTMSPFVPLFRRLGIPRAKIVDVEHTLHAVCECVGGTSYYGASQFTDPSRCPIYLELEGGRVSRRLLAKTRDHVVFLNDLYTCSKRDKAKFTEYQSIIGESGVGLVDKIDFQETEAPSSVYDVRIGGRVTQKEVRRLLVIPCFHIKRTQLSPNQLSEGTFKTIALIFYLMTDKGTILLVEEPEVCVHHGLLDSIISLIKSVSGDRQIIMSTHSDFVLDAMDPNNVFVVNNESHGGTVVRHVPKALSAAAYAGLRDYLKGSGNLGEYWRHGGFER